MINYRFANSSDIDSIYEFGKATNEFTTSDEVVNFWPKNILEKCIGAPDVLICVAEEDRELLGFILVNLNISLKKAEIENIVVKEPLRKTKIGSNLLKFALAEAIKNDFEYICHLSSDEVMHFFVKNGFNIGRKFTWMDFIAAEEYKKQN